jgi:hypothetical protein
VDTPNKPQASEEEQEVLGPPVPALSPTLQARSPFRPLSRRRRQAQVAEPPSVVERPSTSLVFDASPTTVAAALAKAGGSRAELSLTWRVGQDSDSEVTVEITAEEDDGAGTASPR